MFSCIPPGDAVDVPIYDEICKTRALRGIKCFPVLCSIYDIRCCQAAVFFKSPVPEKYLVIVIYNKLRYVRSLHGILHGLLRSRYRDGLPYLMGTFDKLCFRSAPFLEIEVSTDVE